MSVTQIHAPTRDDVISKAVSARRTRNVAVPTTRLISRGAAVADVNLFGSTLIEEKVHPGLPYPVSQDPSRLHRERSPSRSRLRHDDHSSELNHVGNG